MRDVWLLATRATELMFEATFQTTTGLFVFT
jgi:hypothetical protein